jgi:ribosomal protein S27AE
MGLKSGICPQCGSDEIYVGTGSGDNDSNNYFVISRKFRFFYKVAFIERYVCSDCHYMETYIEDEQSMKYIREAFKPLNKEKRKNKG